MNYGLYLSASGALANMYRQDVFANNLANVNTVGFKHDLAAITQRRPEAREDLHGPDVSQRLLDKLGGGVFAGPQRITFAQGAIQETAGPLDVAITRPGQFFVLQAPQGQEGFRLTRDGRFTIDSNGFLVSATNGLRVMGVDEGPIRVNDSSPAFIDGRGRLIQNQQPAGQVQVTQVNDLSRLTKEGGNLFHWSGKGDPRSEPDALYIQTEAVEGSSIDPVTAMMDMIDATRAAEGNARLISYHDTLMDRAINTFGRVG